MSGPGAASSIPRPPAPHVAIVGGGLAGQAAAIALAGRGLRITLIESRNRLGGRATSFLDPATGEALDNCQHVAMGCCTNLADFCRRTGIRDLFRPLHTPVFFERDGRVSEFRAGSLPAPFHLTRAFVGARYLSWTDKLRLAAAMVALRLDTRGRYGETFGAWLDRHGQTARCRDHFWTPVLVSALNDQLDRLDYGLSRKILLDGFLRSRDAHVIEVPAAPLLHLYDECMRPQLAAREIDLRTGRAVRTLRTDDDGLLAGLTFRDGEVLDADFVILAVPFQRVGDLIPQSLRPALARPLEAVATMEPSPITGVHLWFDRQAVTVPHAVVLDRLVQWVFDHTAFAEGGGDGSSQHLQVVISASHELLALGKDQILARVVDDLAALWPAVREATLLRSWVVTEHAATFALPPGIEWVRPPQRTRVDGLVLAGDWTATTWPATMEGAVRSGYLAAEVVLQDLGRAERLLRPDLKPGRLARWLLGPSPPSRPLGAFYPEDVRPDDLMALPPGG
jgi:squalene-associated FAD-dependent desaturase